MKKAKILSALMALTLAAVPTTGIAGSTLSFSNNAIVADAAYAPSSRKVDGSYLVFRSNPVDPILSTGENGYNLYYRNGYMVITKAYYAQGRRYEYNVKMFYVGGNSLLLQGDGNLVAYNCASPNDFSRPTAHSNTWMYNQPDVYFLYELSTSGILHIYRVQKSGQFKGMKEPLWNSTTGKMYRI